MKKKTWICLAAFAGVILAAAAVMMVLASPRKLHYGKRCISEDEI